MSGFKIRIVLCIVFLVVFGLHGTSWGVSVGLQADTDSPETTHTTRTIDTDDITFSLKATKDFTAIAASLAFTVEGASATLNQSSFNMTAANTISDGTLVVTVPRTALTDIGTYEITVTVTATFPTNAEPGSITLTVIVRDTNMLEVLPETINGAYYTNTRGIYNTDTGDVTYTLQVKNLGKAEDTIILSKTGDTTDDKIDVSGQATFSEAEVTLAGGAITDVTMTIPKAAIDIPGTYVIYITATSKHGITQSIQVTTTTVVQKDPQAAVTLLVKDDSGPTRTTLVDDTGNITFSLECEEYFSGSFVAEPVCTPIATPPFLECNTPSAPDWNVELAVSGDISTATVTPKVANAADFTLSSLAKQAVKLTVPRTALANAGRYVITVTATPTAPGTFTSVPTSASVTVIVKGDSDRPTATPEYYEFLSETTVRIYSNEDDALKLASPLLEQLVDIHSDPNGYAMFKIDFGESVSSSKTDPTAESFSLSELTIVEVRDVIDGRVITLQGITVESVQRVEGSSSAYRVLLSMPKAIFGRLPITLSMGVGEDAVYATDGGVGNVESYFFLHIVDRFASEISALRYGLTLKEVGDKSQIIAPDSTEDVTYTLRVTNSGTVADTINLEMLGDVTGVVLSQTTMELGPDVAQDVTVTIPRSALTEQRTYRLNVKATSEGDPTQVAQLIFQTVLTDEDPENVVIEETTQSVIITEFMFETTGGAEALPLWIELYNNSTAAVNLRGWKLQWQQMKPTPVKLTITLKEDFTIPSEQCRLIVSTFDRHSSGSKLGNEDVYSLLRLHAEEFVLSEVDVKSLINHDGFSLKLQTSQGTLVDHIGTIDSEGEVWKLPTCLIDNVRSSLIRRFDKGIPRTGTNRNGWIAANVAKRLPVGLYYGHKTDLGTPGYRRGKPLPVELSEFSPRVVEDEIVINWTTESELNNAGFNIYRSTSRTRNFRRINTKLIAGAGTTGQKSTYQFIDTTAKPNVSYYYRIEDVDFAGKRAILATQKVRGLFSPNNKVITRWASIKSPQ